MKDLLHATLKAVGITLVIFLLFGGWVTWHMSKEGFSFPGPGHQDYSAYLAGDYSVYRTSPFEIIIAPGGYNNGTPIIPSVVTACATDGRYILAQRQDTRQAFRDDPKHTWKEMDPESTNYWILDTQKPEVFGPLSNGDFTAKRRQLGIPDSIKLIPPRAFADMHGPPASLENVKDMPDPFLPMPK